MEISLFIFFRQKRTKYCNTVLLHVSNSFFVRPRQSQQLSFFCPSLIEMTGGSTFTCSNANLKA